MLFYFSKSLFFVLFANQNREVSEWLKELAWKASMWVTASRVRIPSSLLITHLKPLKAFVLGVFTFLLRFKIDSKGTSIICKLLMYVIQDHKAAS